jgi:hypothetical protein
MALAELIANCQLLIARCYLFRLSTGLTGFIRGALRRSS